MRALLSITFVIILHATACAPTPGGTDNPVPAASREAADAGPRLADVPARKPGERRAWVFVALCDNKSQGIVPVPAVLGNGDDPARNLYWGARYGVKTHIRRSPDWRLVDTRPAPDSTGHILERLVFRHRRLNITLVADAYRGARIRRAVWDYSRAASRVRAGDLVVFVGHNGLMDFDLPEVAADASARGGRSGGDAAVLACRSGPYFEKRHRAAEARTLVTTTGLMAPEAYVLEAVLAGWARKESPNSVRARAAVAYHRYQKCGIRAARRLFALPP